MELFFLAILVFLMIGALVSGFPVAFALPGSAIIAISLAAVCGLIFAGDSSAYFADGGPVQWLTAGVTNFRSIYWEVERDTLIAIPLFIFMGIMLQRSKIAEDLLVAMAQLFGPVPGGLGISVVLVGALLAATTGIVGATVVAMGMISLPAMLRNNYSKSLATGTICASGTLGQIIPPSIVLIILADQLSSAADQASTMRAAAYRAATGEFSMPSHLDVVSASAGDMFMGAIIPGLVLVGLYILYILGSALLRPKSAPPVPYEGEYDRSFMANVLKALIPPLALIIAVLGSILSGVATVNQAGAIGAVGAILMGGYRLYKGEKHVYTPSMIALASVIGLGLLLSIWNINVKNLETSGQSFALVIAVILVVFLILGIAWSIIRVHRTDNTLHDVMIETVKTTSMVFVILLGAAMLTAAFRAFGGEELVRHALTSLPGGFWTQFFVVMLVIFVLGFFLDFIEIAVVVVPLVAPILLAAPDANITAVWLGVMIGLNMQTSFLTPPFGFALFYLRGVASKAVKTMDIYKGVIPFIGLQLLALVIVGFMPFLVNYLPNKTFLTSENSPPPINPKLQQCLEEEVFSVYARDEGKILDAIEAMRQIDVSMLPEQYQSSLSDSLSQAAQTFEKVSVVREAELAVEEASNAYRPLHGNVRQIEREQNQLLAKVEELTKFIADARYEESTSAEDVLDAEKEIAELEAEVERLTATIPESWQETQSTYQALEKTLKTSRFAYRNHVDNTYTPFQELLQVIQAKDELAALRGDIESIESRIENDGAEATMEWIKTFEDRLADVPGSYDVARLVTKARRALRGDTPDTVEAVLYKNQAIDQLIQDLAWLEQASEQVLPHLLAFDEVIATNIGVRQQPKLSESMALSIAACQSHHRDVSLSF
ncbi:TRAP transporter large permease subunit [Reinekea marina]|uniref:TRAP transporter large permease subunit n=1 Tax=Reinekea marina TaxID=1310421 RepID=A0ABV7WTJ1_9GAMM|nr:TRAP transporter large permease subunit [Reinekea marina]MDN3650017.1 TRAP transporter large permease subunit [Reinekea marina]